MAIGSWRIVPDFVSVAAAVASLPIDAPIKTPCSHDIASTTNGTRCVRRPPKRMAEIGTPSGSCQCGEIDGHWEADGCREARIGMRGFLGTCGSPGVALPIRQFVRCRFDKPSHQTLPFSSTATFVKMELADAVLSAFGLVLADVPGATPKKPASGLMAYRRPSACHSASRRCRRRWSRPSTREWSDAA